MSFKNIYYDVDLATKLVSKPCLETEKLEKLKSELQRSLDTSIPSSACYALAAKLLRIIELDAVR